MWVQTRRHSPFWSVIAAVSPRTSWVTCSARIRGSARTGAIAARAIAAGTTTSPSLALLGCRLRGAVPAECNSPEGADQTDEGSAAGARVAFGGAFLLATSAATHSVMFLDFGHSATHAMRL